MLRGAGPAPPTVSTVQNQFVKQAKGSAVDNLNIDIFKNISIPLPDLSTQQEIVNQIEQEEKIIEENKKLIEIMANKMRKKIDNHFKWPLTSPSYNTL